MQDLTRRQFLGDCTKLAGLGAAAASGLVPLGQLHAAEPVKTKTDTVPAEGASFTFALVADPHAGDVPRKDMNVANPVDGFTITTNALNTLAGDDAPDFVLFLGDLHFFKLPPEIIKANFNCRMPVHVIHGNSLSYNRPQTREWFPNDFTLDGKPSDYYSFVHKGVRMICTCNCIRDDHTGHLASGNIIPRGQGAWIEKELASPEKQKLLFGHIPIHPESQDLDMWMAPNDNIFLIELIRKYKPTAAYFGHRHRNESYQIADTPAHQLASPTISVEGDPLGFALCKLTPQGVTHKFLEFGKDYK